VGLNSFLFYIFYILMLGLLKVGSVCYSLGCCEGVFNDYFLRRKISLLPFCKVLLFFASRILEISSYKASRSLMFSLGFFDRLKNIRFLLFVLGFVFSFYFLVIY
jgi:hypothetical protein